MMAEGDDGEVPGMMEDVDFVFPVKGQVNNHRQWKHEQERKEERLSSQIE